MKMLAAGLATLAALAFGGSAQAQAPVPRSAVSFNPIGLVFAVFTGEFEHALAPSYSAGVSASHWSSAGDGGVSYVSADLKVRHYPSATALRGFAVGGSAGLTRLGGRFEDEKGEERRNAHALSVGVLVDYNWLLGADNGFFVGAGVGAKRLFPIGISDENVIPAHPTLRLNVGFAF